ncbi:hypothetical protein RRG08_054417 [Elysia crispata]|uniref:Plethodontid modulating factor n=1 Tax=Elysia crispata TaxID=231223 RepID=A0AAE1AVR6_9GAST|nr:hypothetical protein RRG08_054417 [Elysia crispata]
MAKVALIICISLAVSCLAYPEEPCTADIAGPDGEASLCVGVRSTARDSVTGMFYCCPNGGDPTESSHTTNMGGKQLHHYQCDCLTPSERCDKYPFFC